MGWGKVPTFLVGHPIDFGNWLVKPGTSGELIFNYPANGIVYTKTDTTFSGTHFKTEVNTGNLQIAKEPGWLDSTTQDELYELSEEQTWDDAVNTGQELIDFVLGSTVSDVYYEGSCYFISDAIDLTNIGVYHTTLLNWVESAKPAGTTITVQTSVFNGSTWSDWSTDANNSSINNMPATGTDLSEKPYKVKYKVILSASETDTPKISEVKTTYKSRKHMVLTSTGIQTYNDITKVTNVAL